MFISWILPNFVSKIQSAFDIVNPKFCHISDVEVVG